MLDITRDKHASMKIREAGEAGAMGHLGGKLVNGGRFANEPAIYSKEDFWKCRISLCQETEDGFGPMGLS
jgi:hypothetical protein